MAEPERFDAGTQVRPRATVEGLFHVAREHDRALILIDLFVQVSLNHFDCHGGLADERPRHEADLLVADKLRDDAQHALRENACEDFVVPVQQRDRAVVSDVGATPFLIQDGHDAI